MKMSEEDFAVVQRKADHIKTLRDAMNVRQKELDEMVLPLLGLKKGDLVEIQTGHYDAGKRYLVERGSIQRYIWADRGLAHPTIHGYLTKKDGTRRLGSGLRSISAAQVEKV